tara:strand:+ start:503 stop:1114 length:612 start_codon:yes stop_codon:yes gene_type:complete
MAMSLKEYLNSKIKSKGSSITKEKAKAKKYKSISAAKKAGALYYTNKDGKVMAAVYAEDLKKAKPKVKPIPRPKPRPKLGAGKQPKVETRVLSPHTTGGGRGDGKIEMTARKRANIKPITNIQIIRMVKTALGPEEVKKLKKKNKLSEADKARVKKIFKQVQKETGDDPKTLMDNVARFFRDLQAAGGIGNIRSYRKGKDPRK